MIKPSKPKYCCLCAQKGHEAEKCNRANRTIGPLSVHVVNYCPVLRAPSNEVPNSAPKCTILASHITGFSFNYGNDVSYKGNSLYARFRRAVNLSDDRQKQSGNNDVMFVSETNLRDTSEPPIEVYDDDFGYDDDFDNISSTEQFSSDSVHDSSFMTIDNVDTDDNNSQSIDSQKTNTNNGNAEIQELDSKMQTLSDLKEKILSQTSTNASNQNSSAIGEERDVSIKNVSTRQIDDISSTAALADFIPLSSHKPDKYQPTRSPSPVSADSTTAINEQTDATIHLTPQHCKQLVTDKGHQFLRNRSEYFNVTARLEWRNYGNILIVNGMPAGQKDFHNELKEFFLANEPVKPNYSSFINNLPKNRGTLIKFIRSNFILLDSAICNKSFGLDPVGLYHRICFNQQNPSKASMRQVSKFRKQLNMILFGRYGFADGRAHLNALQNCLRDIINMNTIVNVPHQVRTRICKHIDYIFSDMDHGNYENIIEHYNTMRRNKSLPSLNLDRHLLGLKINVFDNGDSNENTPRGQHYQRNALNTFAGKNSNASFEHSHGNGNAIGNSNSNRMNALPTSNNIQINVSKPSTSHYNQNNQNNGRFNSALDKWKY